MHKQTLSLSGRESEVYLAATMYYVEGETMDTISRQLGVSRSTVSRLLQLARATGVVRIELSEPRGSSSSLATKLNQKFGITTHVAPLKNGLSELARLDRVSRLAASLLSDCVGDGTTIGMAWGTTVAAVVDHLPRLDRHGVRVVQINGASNPHTTANSYVGSVLGEAAAAFGGQVVLFPVPCFFDYVETKQMMWRERSIQRVLAIHNEIDVAIFGVGSFRGPVASHVYSSGYLTREEQIELQRDGAVGDICTIFLKANGSSSGIELNQRASGMTPEQLRRLPRRICVAAGEFRIPGLLAALRSHAVTDLVIDEASAAELLRRGQ